MKRLQWFWCYLAYRLYLALPMPTFNSTYWKVNMWLLGYAGAYAHSEDFKYFCEHVRFSEPQR